ncbi:DDE transposase [Dokdonia pacifica]|uniref:ISXO2-like transposase domain-containing protein n=1 Tax=Dokdonia pacifica TaxID=1627892 RepID=A0A238W440_9FLAO|nr:IS1595 family transposase [Dokdonia pacifica]GGG15262.1 DDE transposase [Dokdonia pacifica]SNR41157.1 ISXO2-like transposase domain-containing protein [Dokdonia pacifica]
MFNEEVKSILQLIQAFPDEQSCIDHLEKLRWNGNVVSPFDSTSKVYNCKGNRYKCKETGKYFNVKTNTIFDNTKMPLQKWFLAIWLVTSHKKGISSLQLGRDLDITQKSAWFMLQRIRNCFGLNNDDQMDGEIEADETYVGGKDKNRHANKKVKGNRDDKAPVLGMVQRDGKLKAVKVPNTTTETLSTEIINAVKEGATLYTDEYSSYKALKRIYDHQFVKHSSKQYVNGRIHTNTIEGFWSLLKRGIFGIYHFTSKKHLQMYVDEFVFRYNTRKGTENERFNLLLSNIENRITYKELIK